MKKFALRHVALGESTRAMDEDAVEGVAEASADRPEDIHVGMENAVPARSCDEGLRQDHDVVLTEIGVSSIRLEADDHAIAGTELVVSADLTTSGEAIGMNGGHGRTIDRDACGRTGAVEGSQAATLVESIAGVNTQICAGPGEEGRRRHEGGRRAAQGQVGRASLWGNGGDADGRQQQQLFRFLKTTPSRY